MKKILLTGGSGFIGRNVLESYLAQKYEIIAPSSKELNTIDTNSVDEFFKDKYFDVILHSATKPGHRNAKDHNNLFYSNVRMFQNLEKHKDKYNKFINFGSGAIYNTSKDIKDAREEYRFSSIGEKEHDFCKYVVAKQIAKIPNFVDLNIFGIFGKYEDFEIRFISNLICKALFNLPLTMNQNRKFSYLFIDDLIPILEFFIENNLKSSSYNIVPTESLFLLDIANIIKKITNTGADIVIANSGLGLEYTGNNSSLLSEYKDCKFTNIEDSIFKLKSYYEQILNSIDINLFINDK